jgi:hypothetical protein
MRGVRPWPVEGECPRGEIVCASGHCVCGGKLLTEEGVELRHIRSTPEPITIGEMCRAVRFLVSALGGELGMVDEMLRDGRAGVILDGQQQGVGIRIRSLLNGGGFRWSACALDDYWLTLLFEAVEFWRRGQQLDGRCLG